MTTLISKTTSHFCHEWQKARVLSRHLVSIERASISILIIIIILGCPVVLRCLKMRRKRLHKATKASLPSSNMADMGVQLIQLNNKCIKASNQVLKLRHDCIKSHTSHKRRGSEGGWSWRMGGAVVLDHLQCSYASLCLTVVVFMSHITWKLSKIAKRIEKWRKILMIA